MQDPNYTFSRDPNCSANFVTQAMQLNMDVCVTLDKLYSDPDQTSDNPTHHSKCSDCDENDDTKGDTTKLKYCKESAAELNHSPRLTKEVVADDPKHNKQESVSNCEQDSYYLEKFEQERKLRMAAEEKVKELQVHNKFLESILKKSRERHDKEMEKYEELDKKQKEEIARLQKESDRLKRKLSDSQIASNQLKNYVEGLVQLGEAYQGEPQNLQEKLNHMKQELDNTLVQKAQLEKQNQALEGDKEQLSSQVQSLSPTSQWKIDRNELTITANDLGRGAWGYVREGIFHGTKVAVKAIHQEIISLADEVIQREFSMMAQVRHPNLVLLIGTVFKDPQHKAGPLIITELLDGTLRSAYEANRLDKQCRLPLLRDVAAALNYLHTHHQSFIHRDVSSTNIMLETSDNGKWKRVKPGDFGSAKLTSHAATPVPGAAIYSAPEMLPATKGKQTTKVDVYSFGVLFCEVLLARLPPDFDPNSNDFSKFMANLKRLEGKDIHQTAHICTNRNPRKRPTMKDVLQDIDRHIM